MTPSAASEASSKHKAGGHDRCQQFQGGNERQGQNDGQRHGHDGRVVERRDIQTLQNGQQVFADKTHKDGANRQLLRADADRHVGLKARAVGPLADFGVGDIGGSPRGRFELAVVVAVVGTKGVHVGVVCVIVGLCWFIDRVGHVTGGPFHVPLQLHDGPAVVTGPQTQGKNAEHAARHAQLADGPRQTQTARAHVAFDQVQKGFRGVRLVVKLEWWKAIRSVGHGLRRGGFGAAAFVVRDLVTRKLVVAL